MEESDLLPKNVMKLYSLYCRSLYEEGEGGERGRGGGGGGGGGRSTYSLYCHSVSLSLQLCEEELKN